MPWEMGFITWCLADKEIKPLTVTELDETVLQLSSPSASMSSDLVSNPFTQAKLVQMHSDTYNTVGDLLQRLEPSAIKESFLSLLGYYIPKSDVLRAKKTVVLEGLRLWSTNVCGLEVPPYVSPEFLRKMGMWDNRSQHFSKPLEQMHRSVDPKKAPATRWLRAEDADDEEVKMYRTGLYKFERGRKQDQSSQAKPVI
jgi:ATP-dependent RNA helicase MSS116